MSSLSPHAMGFGDFDTRIPYSCSIERLSTFASIPVEEDPTAPAAAEEEARYVFMGFEPKTLLRAWPATKMRQAACRAPGSGAHRRRHRHQRVETSFTGAKDGSGAGRTKRLGRP
jgi:hypothetical protein